jgi:hypothetical protein
VTLSHVTLSSGHMGIAWLLERIAWCYVSVVLQLVPSEKMAVLHAPDGTNPGPNPALRLSVLHPGTAPPRARHEGASFLGQQSIQTQQILLEFYPSVQNTSQFMSHDWEHGKAIVIRIFLLALLQPWPEQCGWEWWGYHIVVSWRYRRS